MTLSERIKAANPGDVFFVGSASGYVFIGNSSEFFKDEKRISKTEQARFKDILRKDVACLKKYDRMYELGLDIKDANSIDTKKLRSIAKECVAAKEEIERLSEKSTVSWLKKAVKGTTSSLFELHSVCKSFPKDKKHSDTFIPFSDREIKDEYQRIDGGTALIVDGYEAGNYWLPEEYATKKVVED